MNKISLTNNYKIFKNTLNTEKKTNKFIIKGSKRNNLNLNIFLNRIIPGYSNKYSEFSLYSVRDISNNKVILDISKNIKFKNSNRVALSYKKKNKIKELHKINSSKYNLLKKKLNFIVKKKYNKF